MHQLRLALLLTLVASAAIVAAPGAAFAVEAPTILTTGFDARDQLYATWSLAPGTSFTHIEFATLPVADPELPEYFIDGQFAAYDYCRRASCGGKTSFTAEYPLKRDRRYFVKVTANVGRERATSAVWVIDETKPLIPGSAKVGDGDSNTPVAGKPFDGTGLLPPGVVPTASYKLSKAPKTIRGLLLKGVGMSVTCSVACSVETELSTPEDIVGLRSVGFAAGGTHKLAARVDELDRPIVRRLKRARITLEVVITLLDGTRKKAHRKFTVHR